MEAFLLNLQVTLTRVETHSPASHLTNEETEAPRQRWLPVPGPGLASMHTSVGRARWLVNPCRVLSSALRTKTNLKSAPCPK